MKLISWNVNGIRACYKKGLIEFVEREDPDIFMVQETKADPGQCEPAVVHPAGRHGIWSTAKKKGYSGVATFVRSPEQILTSRNGIGIEEYDSEGRFVVTDHPGFTLYNIYFVNGGSGPERHAFKQRFLADLLEHLRPLVEAGRPLVVAGDFNVAHREIDVYDPKGLAQVSGFLREEREWMDRFLELGFVDTFRYRHPQERDRYTWWSYYERGRMANRGWRIDMICVTKNLVDKITRADQLEGQMGSDHCPVVLELSI